MALVDDEESSIKIYDCGLYGEIRLTTLDKYYKYFKLIGCFLTLKNGEYVIYYLKKDEKFVAALIKKINVPVISEKKEPNNTDYLHLYNNNNLVLSYVTIVETARDFKLYLVGPFYEIHRRNLYNLFQKELVPDTLSGLPYVAYPKSNLKPVLEYFFSFNFVVEKLNVSDLTERVFYSMFAELNSYDVEEIETNLYIEWGSKDDFFMILYGSGAFSYMKSISEFNTFYKKTSNKRFFFKKNEFINLLKFLYKKDRLIKLTEKNKKRMISIKIDSTDSHRNSLHFENNEDFIYCLFLIKTMNTEIKAENKTIFIRKSKEEIETFLNSLKQIDVTFSFSTCTRISTPSNDIPLTPEYKKLVEKIPDHLRYSAIEREKSQKIIETFLLKRATCSSLNPGVFNDMKIKFFTLDDEKIDNMMSNYRGMNSDVHANISCALESVIYDGKAPGEFAPYMTQRIHNSFKNIKQIGEPSVEGYALKTSFSDKSDLFIVKTPRSPTDDRLIHEAIVGVYALNNLKRYLPNFMYVYGYANCSPALIENKKVKSWCTSTDSGVSYLFIENIRDAVSFRDFVVNRDVDNKDIYLVFLQVVNALNMAYKKYGYTHYDLHAGNIMVRRYIKKIAVPFYSPDETIVGYIVTQYIPYIIDYGYSRIQIGENIKLGIIGLEEYGFETNRPFPMFDIYRIICFLGESLYRSGVDMSNNRASLLNKLYQFFEEGNLFDRVKKRLYYPARDYYLLTDEKFRYVTHDDYINFLMRTGKALILPTVPEEAFLAPSSYAISSCRFYNMVSSDKGPKNALEYCESVSIINEQTDENEKRKLLSWLNRKYNVQDHFIEEYSQNRREMNSIKTKTRQYTEDVVMYFNNVRYLKDREFMTAYMNTLGVYSEMKIKLFSIDSFLRSFVCALTNQNKMNKDNRKYIVAFENEYEDLKKYMERQKNILKDSVNYLRGIASREAGRMVEIINSAL